MREQVAGIAVGAGWTWAKRFMFTLLGFSLFGLLIATLIALIAGKHSFIGHFNSFKNCFSEEAFLKALYKAQCPRYRDLPFLIVLDEMNLSRPEQYFADFLSSMERAASRPTSPSPRSAAP